MRSARILLILGSFSAAVAIGRADDPPRGAVPGRPMRITVAAADRPNVGGTSDVRPNAVDGVWAVLDPFTLPFATVTKVVVEGPEYGKGDGEVRVEFRGEGDKDPERRFLVEMWASNAEGRILWHTWELQGDARLNQPMRIGSRIATPGLINHVRLEIPHHLTSRVRAVKVQLRAMGPKEWRHQPPSPSPIDLAMTRPDESGQFTLSFTNPEDDSGSDREKDTDRRRVAVTLWVPNEAGATQSRAVRFAAADPDGRYRLPFQLDPKQIDRAEVAIAFYQAQPDNADFGQHFFVEGRPSSYSGSWLSLRRPLLEVPLMD